MLMIDRGRGRLRPGRVRMLYRPMNRIRVFGRMGEHDDALVCRLLVCVKRRITSTYGRSELGDNSLRLCRETTKLRVKLHVRDEDGPSLLSSSAPRGAKYEFHAH